MAKNHKRSEDAADLRQKAEAKVQAMEQSDHAVQTPEETRRVTHELRVHEIELEMQNEELQTAQEEIVASHERYFELYDLAPVGYFSISEQGQILAANLTAANLLGIPSSALVGQLLSSYILKDDQDIYYLYRKQLLASHSTGSGLAGEPQECELRMVKPDGTFIWAQLKGTVAQAKDGAPLCRVAFLDITERKRTEEKLSELASRFRSIFEQSSAGSVIVGMGKRFVKCNPAFRKFLGYNESELVGKTISDVTFPEDRERGMKELKEIAEGKRESFVAQKRYLRKDGHIVWGEVSVSLVRDADNNPLHFLPVITDITERKKSADEAAALREALDSVAGFGFEKDIDLKYVSANRSFCDLLKIPYNKIQGMTDYDIFPADLADKYIADDRRVIETAEPITVEEVTIDSKTNQRFVVQTRKFPRFDKNGRVAGLYGMGYDITELKKAEHALRESEAIKDKLISNIGDVIVIIDQNGINRYKSPNVTKLFGWKPEELIGKNTWENIHPDDLESGQKFFATILAEPNATGTTELRYKRKDGNFVWIEISVINLLNDEYIRGILGNYHDITERKLAAEALEKSNEALHKAVQDLQKAQKQIVQQARLSALGQMASGIAHDFNNILQPIIGFSELLISDPAALDDRNDAIHLLQMIHSAGQDARNIVRRLRTVYKVNYSSKFDILDLSKIVESALSITMPKWKEEMRAKGAIIEIVTDFQPVAKINGNASELREVMTNLIFNAADAMPTGGMITFRLYSEDNTSVVLETTDTGCGMDEATLNQCMEPFFSTKGPQGSGLGLAMVHGIVERHGGTITIKSKPDTGTTVRIRFPVPVEAKVTELAPEQEPAPLSPMNILVVDDEERSSNLLARFLKGDDHRVETANNGRQGLDTLRKGKFDLIITDRAMPVMGGDEFAAEAQKIQPGIPIIMLTGFGEIMKDSGVLPPGVSRVMSKPLTKKDLRSVMSLVMRKAASS